MRAIAFGAVAVTVAAGAAGCLGSNNDVDFTSDPISGDSFTVEHLPSYATFKITGSVTVPSCDDTDAARDGGICTTICPNGGRITLWTYGILVGDTFTQDNTYPVAARFRPEIVDREATCND